jgi:hypothetical protein
MTQPISGKTFNNSPIGFRYTVSGMRIDDKGDF